MKARALLVGLGLCLLLGQALLQTILPPPVRPDLLLVYALVLGLRAGSSFSLVLAFLAGFAVDALSGAPPGLYALLRGTACAATRAVDGALYLRAGGPWAVYVGAYVVVDLLLLGLCLAWFAPEGAPPWSSLILRAPGVVVSTALFALPVLALFRRIESESSRDAGLGMLAGSPRP